MTIDLLPAVDVVDGQAVRLVQGEAGTETGYGDPLDAARAWAADGAEWLHLVDLDAAFGRGSNAELLAVVVEKIDIKVELSGGIRDDASLRRALDTGCRRVNIGTAALEDPRVVREGDRGVRRPGGRRPRREDRRGAAPARRPRLGVRRRRPVERARPPRRRGLRALRRHRRGPRRHAHRAEHRAARGGVRAHRPPGGGVGRGRRRWTTCGPSQRCPAGASRARSSARRSTPAASPWPRRCAVRHRT